jgi:hypothetical protein
MVVEKAGRFMNRPVNGGRKSRAIHESPLHFNVYSPSHISSMLGGLIRTKRSRLQ